MNGPTSRIGFCRQKLRLVDEFLDAIREMNHIQSAQVQAIIEGDPDFARFDILLQMAQAKKDQAKYAWIAHVESHRC